MVKCSRSVRSIGSFLIFDGVTSATQLVNRYCKFINVCEGIIWRISWPSLNRKNKYPTNIIHVPRQPTRPELIANINPREHSFVSKTQTLIAVNINEFTVLCMAVTYKPELILFVKWSSRGSRPLGLLQTYFTTSFMVWSNFRFPFELLKHVCSCLYGLVHIVYCDVCDQNFSFSHQLQWRKKNTAHLSPPWARSVCQECLMPPLMSST